MLPIETTNYDELRLYDAGSWMGDRFAGLRIPLFEEAVRFARDRGIRLILDMKDKGMGADVLEILRREGMLDRVRFGGEWDDVRSLYPAAASAEVKTAWVLPGVTAEQVKAYHEQGKLVIANFSADQHEMDLAGMKLALAAGVDAINVDFPRLGADAVGRPVEDRLHQLAVEADGGDSTARSHAILELARYRGFPLRELFARWLLDEDAHVSRAAALALVLCRPSPGYGLFTPALRSRSSAARRNAAWALGMLHAPAHTFFRCSTIATPAWLPKLCWPPRGCPAMYPPEDSYAVAESSTRRTKSTAWSLPIAARWRCCGRSERFPRGGRIQSCWRKPSHPLRLSLS